jgi:mycothiol synthase
MAGRSLSVHFGPAYVPAWNAGAPGADQVSHAEYEPIPDTKAAVMISIRQAVSDTDLELWRRVRLAVLPNERAATVTEMRALESPVRRLLLAELDGQLAGSGLADVSGFTGYGSITPRVVPDRRHRGVGSALLHSLVEYIDDAGFDRVTTNVSDLGSAEFAARFGFEESERQVEQVLRPVHGITPLPSPEGVTIVTVAEHPELVEKLYDSVASQGYDDMAFDSKLEISYAEWQLFGVGDPQSTFVAMTGGQPIGCAGLTVDQDNSHRAEHSLTAVRRDWRRRGIASLLKHRTLQWAQSHGLDEVYTWTQNGNDAMRRLNERLGYEYRSISLTMRAAISDIRGAAGFSTAEGQTWQESP